MTVIVINENITSQEKIVQLISTVFNPPRKAMQAIPMFGHDASYI